MLSTTDFLPNSAFLSGMGLIPSSASGRVIYRYKSVVKHKGVIIGADESGEWWVLHNHPQTALDLISFTDFVKGQRWYFDLKKTSLPLEQVLENAYSLFERGLRYRVFTNNCQHSASLVAYGKRRSEDLVRFFRGLALASPGGILLVRLLLRLFR